MDAGAGTSDEELDPRVERSRRLVLSATFALLSEVGYGGVTVEAVAARAGVAKSTIYRHWSGRPALIEAAIRANKPPAIDATDGTRREQVLAQVQGVARFVASSTWAACMPALFEAAQRDPEVASLLDSISTGQRAAMADLLRLAQEAGEVDPGADVDLLVDALVGPIFLRRLFSQRSFAPEEVVALVDQVVPAPR